jgi:hypothetical protein
MAFEQFDDDLKHSLIISEDTGFFVYRAPKWRDHLIEFDGFGQRVNGVVNVGYTVDPNYPIWCPIDGASYEQYLVDPNNSETREFLARQVLEVLYAVRNNLVHGEKVADDANDLEVVGHALPLLRLIVMHFLNEQEVADFM